ncbi:hypothetical protein [Salinisphaera sp. T31B1]|uniref:hypothetical protein n=1 Tax=Salinisphaera sp. T31B1 TaxID=727963 RepID=UPI003340F150
MTSINLTLTEDRAWLSQDRAFYDVGKLPPVAVKGAQCEHHATLIGETCKIAVFPYQRLLVGMGGPYVHVNAWRETVRQTGGDIDSLNDIAPHILRLLARDYPAETPEVILIHAGYSPSERCVTAIAYSWEDDFEPMPLGPGLTCTPPPDATAPDYTELQALRTAADQGRDVETFHAALCANQKWQADNGRIRAGVLLSDEYDFASVDKHGARVNTVRKAQAVA